MGADGSGVDGSASGTVSLPVALTAGTSHYGRAVQVEVRACRQYEQVLCGDWSGPFPVATAVRIDLEPSFVPLGEQPNDRSVEIAWTPLEQLDYDSVEYLCTGGEIATDPAVSPCTITSGPSDDPRLVVTVTVDSVAYTREYRP